jgi:glycosyltransferase involved in cell wall biosynthesis
MTHFPSVSICIPTYNQSSFLPAAIDSALHQSDVDVEVFVSDDCSSDATEAVLAAYSSNPRVHAYFSPVNSGICSNASQVISAAKTKYLVRLDSDDILYPDYCSTLVQLLDDCPSAAVGHCAVDQIDGTGQYTSIRRLARRSGLQSSTQALRQSIHGYKVSANILMFRREALFNLPFLYDPAIPFTEDWDLYSRLAIAGWGNVYTTQTLAAYRVWRNPSDFNAKRKIAEIDGIFHVLVNTLLPAWEACGWDIAAISGARRKFACAQSVSLVSSVVADEDRALLHQSLVSLAAADHHYIEQCINRYLKESEANISFKKLLSRAKKHLKELAFG